jgi:galactonate dehydratase
MKITKVEIFHVRATWSPNWHPVIIRINTDEGLSGLGEVGLAIGVGHSAGMGMVKDLAERFVIGADPMKNERLWEDMFRRGFWTLGGGAAVYGGMSAIDEALWDIRGKALGVPVHVILGGKTNEKLRAYASQLQFRWTEEINQKPAVKPEEYAEEALKAVSEGYTAVKVDPLHFDETGRLEGWDLRRVIKADKLKVIYERMKAIRDAVGPDVDILLEAHAFLSTTTAIQIARLLEGLSLFFYEEPVSPLDVEAMVKVSQNARIPIAAGERIYSRWGYREYFERHALDIVQPDLGLVGGITEGKKICDFANVYDIFVQCHVCASPVATACALQLEAAIPNFIIHEHLTWALKRDLRNLVKPDLQPKNGYFDVPDAPGLGIELNDKVMAQYLAEEVK